MARGDPVAGAKHYRSGVEVVEGHLGDVGGDVIEVGAAGACVTGYDDAAGLLHGLKHLVVVERNEGARVDDLGLHSILLLQDVGGLKGAVQCGADGEERHILADSLDIRLTDRNLIIFLRHTAFVEHLALVVNPLAFKEYHRVGALERGVHQALRVIRSDREADLESRNMAAQRGPVLRVLGTVLRADGHAYDNRHLQDVAGHRLPLRKLIEYLVSAAAEEVAVHDLRNHTATAHGITDGGSDNRGLGDRGIEQTMIRQSLGQSSIDCESAAPLTVLLAVGDEGGILVEAVNDCLEYSVPDVECLHLAGRLAVLVEVEPGLAGNLLHARVLLKRHVHVRLRVAQGVNALVGEHHVAQKLALLHKIHTWRKLGVDGKLVAIEYVGVDLGADSVESGLVGHPGLFQPLAESDDAVLLLPGLDLLLCTVRRLVARRVSAVTVGDDIQKSGAFLFKQIGLLAVERVDDGERIVAVHPFGVHGVGLETCAKAGREGVAHGLALGLAAHRVLVVHHVEENRKSALHVAFPKGVELVHGGECHALKHRASGHRSVTEVGDDDAFLAVDLLVESGSHGNRAGTAHNGVVRVDSERSEERVHRSAQTLVEAGRAGENLGHRSVEQEADSEFLGVLPVVGFPGHVQGGAAPELLHHLLQFILRKNLDGAESLGENLTVGAV